jgi:hypothetical protein
VNRAADFGKRVVIVTSLGRTGTLFFGEKLSALIEDAVSYHEADVLILREIRNWPAKFRGQNPLWMTLGKFHPRRSLATLSVARMAGKVGDDEAVSIIRTLREKFFSAQTARLVIEANLQYVGLADLIPRAFPEANVVYIVRDPRPWVKSWMNRAEGHYSRADFRAWLPGTRLRASHVPEIPLMRPWNRMNRFEKLCWSWAAHHRFLLPRIAANPRVRVVRFEDLFVSAGKEERFRDLMDFITTFPDGFRAAYRFDPGLLERRVHATAVERFPGWRRWSSAQCRSLDHFCGAAMAHFGYGKEAEWTDRLA